MKLRPYDPDANAAGGNAGDQQGGNNQFDPEKFRNEIMESNKEMFQSMNDSLVKNLNEVIENKLSDHVDNQTSSNRSRQEVNERTKELEAEFAEEIASLQLDEDQTSALTSMMSKIINKQIPTIKENVMGEVSRNDDFKTKRQDANVKVAQQYPDVANPNSALRKAANQIFAGYSEKERAKNPKAMANAVREAASELGIAPLTREQISQRDSQNPGGSPPASGKGDGLTDKDYGFAAAFGISKEKFKEKMKETTSRVRT